MLISKLLSVSFGVVLSPFAFPRCVLVQPNSFINSFILVNPFSSASSSFLTLLYFFPIAIAISVATELDESGNTYVDASITSNFSSVSNLLLQYGLHSSNEYCDSIILSFSKSNNFKAAYPINIFVVDAPSLLSFSFVLASTIPFSSDITILGLLLLTVSNIFFGIDIVLE